MEIKLILMTCIVNFIGLTFVQPQDQKLEHQSQNLFDSIARDGAIPNSIYRDNLKQQSTREQRNPSEKIVLVKRETNGTEQGAKKKVIMIRRDDENFKRELSATDAHLMVAMYGQKSCGPCRQLAPTYNNFPQKYPNVTFLKVDIEECPEIAEEQNVQNSPTFIFYRDRKAVDTFPGSIIAKVEEKIVQHY